jgi:alanine racemase
MDSMMIDLGMTTQARVGDEVILLGSSGEEHIRAEELARLAETIPYEIVTRLDPDLPRFYRSCQPSAVSGQPKTAEAED